MEKLTPQEVFDKAASGVLAQGKQAATPDGMCKYRAPDGCKCAAGHVLPDEMYDPEMEGDSICDYPAAPVFENICAEGAFGLLYRLQRAHDEEYNWHNGTASMAQAFQRVAQRFNLDDSVCLPYLT